MPFSAQLMKLAFARIAKLAVLGSALQLMLPFSAFAGKSYSSGGHSYSSGSHHSSSGSSYHSSSTHPSSSSHSTVGSSGGHSSSGSKSVSSGSGKSYSSHSSQNTDAKGYSSGKSYSAGASPKPARENKPPSIPDTSTSKSYSSGNKKYSGESVLPVDSKPTDNNSSSFSFDAGAARARKEEASRQEFNRYKEEHQTTVTRQNTTLTDSRPPAAAPPPIATSTHRSTTVYVPDTYTIRTRSARWGNIFTPYYYRPVVVYHDSFNSYFWWWLLDQSLDQRAYWAYHHRWDMDDARYQALLASDAHLQARVAELEAQQVPRDPSFTPTGLDRDLMYDEHYVRHAYSNRPTATGRIAFWVFAVPMAGLGCAFFIWIIWFKRWKTAT